MQKIDVERTDKKAFDLYYKEQATGLSCEKTPADFVRDFESRKLIPYHLGGTFYNTMGFGRGLATKRLLQVAETSGKAKTDITILDAGCGPGDLSVYLACRGYNVIGVDISAEGCSAGEELALKVGVSGHCTFVSDNLESTSIKKASIDYVIGFGSLHHFIKYEGVPAELLRIMKSGARGFFADGFGENGIYHLFRDKKYLERFGDVRLTKRLINDCFNAFDIELIPTDWFVLLDKLYLKLLSPGFQPLIQKLSYLHFRLDRMIPQKSRAALYLSGSALTLIRKPMGNQSPCYHVHG